MSTAGWLSGTDSSWSVLRGKAIFTERKEKSTEADVHLTPSQHLGVLPQAEYMERSGSRVVLNLTGADQMKHVEPNDFVIHLRSFQGGIEHSRYAGKVSNAYTILTPDSRCEPRFFRWVLKCSGFIQELNSLTDQLRDGQSIKYSQFAEMNLPLPPLEEQRRIADFLDDQVGRIDQAIELRQSQDLQIESRIRTLIASCISGTVHDEDASLGWSPSGATVAFKHLCTDGGQYGLNVPADDYAESGTRLLRTSDLSTSGNFSTEGIYVEGPVEGRFLVGPGDLLLTRSGTIGQVFQVPEDLGGCAFAGFLIRFRANSERALPRFLFYVAQSHQFQASVFSDAVTSTISNFNAERYANIRVPAISLEAQRAVVELLDRKVPEAREMQRNIEVGKNSLFERRRSLITAAVTGQIDVTATRPLAGPLVAPAHSINVETTHEPAGMSL